MELYDDGHGWVEFRHNGKTDSDGGFKYVYPLPNAKKLKRFLRERTFLEIDNCIVVIFEFGCEVIFRNDLTVGWPYFHFWPLTYQVQRIPWRAKQIDTRTWRKENRIYIKFESEIYGYKINYDSRVFEPLKNKWYSNIF